MTRLTESEAAAMTVNERLFVAGLMATFDDAVARRDEGELRRVLGQVFLSPSNIDAVVRQVLSQ